MAFGGFGATPTSSAFGTPGFGAAVKPTGFGTSAFGGFGTTTSAPAFGTATSTTGFGAASTGFGSTAPAFGTSTFGSTAPTFGTSAAPAFGSTTTPAFGSTTTQGFGAAAPAFGTSSAPAFGSSSTPAFGSAPSAFGTSAAPAFGSSAAPAFGSTTAPAFGSATSGFGSTPAFGSTATTAFGSAPAPAFGAGGGAFSFSSNAPGSSLIRPTASFGFGQQQPSLFQTAQQSQQQQQPQPSETDLIDFAVYACNVFGDDRDDVLRRWNMLQACWGVGKAVYNASMPPVNLTPENRYCKFKAIGYSALPKADKESETQVSCIVRKKPTETEKNKAQMIADLSSALGNRPNIRVNADAVNGFEASDVSEVVFTVIESNGATTRKVPPSEFLPVLTAPNVAQALQQKYNVEGMSQRCSYTEDQLREYLEAPPQGIDVRLWRQAQLDNPDPKKLIPVPMIGFKSLNTRIKCQEMQAKHQQGRLDSIAGDISKLQKNQQETYAKLLDAKRKQLELGHRVLKVIIGQEITRKRGYTIQPEEENLRIQLEALQAEMSAPTQFKGRLNELLSQVRLQSQASAMSGGGEKYNMDPFLLSDIKTLLKQQQDGLQALVGSIKQDISDLNIIEHHGKTV